MKEEFINYVNALRMAAPSVEITPGAEKYLTALMSDKVTEKPEITDNGKIVLKYLQTAPDGVYKSRDIAEGLFVSSRMVSGTIRKLVTDGYVDKIGTDPTIYCITEKGKNFTIN